MMYHFKYMYCELRTKTSHTFPLVFSSNIQFKLSTKTSRQFHVVPLQVWIPAIVCSKSSTRSAASSCRFFCGKLDVSTTWFLTINHCWCHFSGTLLVESSLTTSLSMVVQRLRFADFVGEISFKRMISACRPK